ncbi:MAG: DUF512 domain-containing protein [Pyrinomonadaceae bacterium]
MAALYPRVTSVAIVPLGLTRYNTDARLTAVTPEFCERTIREIEPLQRALRKRLGTTFALLGDEIYLRAGRAVPPRGHYGDYPQIEDGIGMVRSFQNSCDALLRRLARRPPQKPERFSATVMTGTLFAPILERSLALLNDKFRTDFEVVAVENTYFGGDVSVAGLLTGSDILAARGRVRKPLLIVPRSAIKSDETVMLDGMTIAELERQLAVPVVAYDFASLARMLTD